MPRLFVNRLEPEAAPPFDELEPDTRLADQARADFSVQWIDIVHGRRTPGNIV